MNTCDVAIIGAGPIGSMAAKYAAKSGAEAILLEEHSCIGWPVQCAGLLGLRALDESEIAGGSFMQRGMLGASVFSPGGRVLDFKARSPRAFVVDRRLFDRTMALEALREGANLRLRSMVQKVRKSEGFQILTLKSGEEVRSKVVISAEGVRARLAHESGIALPRTVLSGSQVEVPFRVNDPEKVEVHLGQAPGLFAWVIPTSDETARIGLCARESGCDYLRVFLKKDAIQKRIRGSAVVMNVGGLPLGPPGKTFADGLLVVGDAAGHVKPTSGGGIYPGLVAAKIAGTVAAKAALEGDSSAKRLYEYDRLWRAKLGREIEIGMRINRMLSKMSDTEIDELVGFMAGKPQIIEAIEQFGDIDRPSLLLARMLSGLDWNMVKLARMLRHVMG